jgi:hypothetical protein
MAALGLGRVKTLIRDGVTISVGAVLASGADSRRLGRIGDRMRAYVCDDYVLIAATSGWTPIMFMTRVRL